MDFSAIDANTVVGGGGGNGQAFTSFQGNGAFTGAQQLRAEQVDTNGDSVFDSTVVQGNVNADLSADFEVLLQNYLGPLQASDFIF